MGVGVGEGPSASQRVSYKSELKFILELKFENQIGFFIIQVT